MEMLERTLKRQATKGNADFAGRITRCFIQLGCRDVPEAFTPAPIHLGALSVCAAHGPRIPGCLAGRPRR